MPSPFPGMDPFLERHWPDVHAKLVTFSSEALNGRLPDDLVARTEENVGIDGSFDPKFRKYRPDIRVVQPGVLNEDAVRDDGAVAVLAPMKLVVQMDPIVERSVQIITAEGERLITVIEFLSPSNKIGRGLAKYRERREQFIEGGANVVEYDLIRRGDFRDLLDPHLVPPEGVTTYRVTIRTARDTAYLYPLRLSDPIPPIPIPLRPGDPIVMLDVQPLLARAYDGGRYARTIDYTRPPDPPLDADDAAWAASLLAARIA